MFVEGSFFLLRICNNVWKLNLLLITMIIVLNLKEGIFNEH